MDIAVIGITPVGCTIACLLSHAGHGVTIAGPAEKADKIGTGGITVRQVWDGSTITSPVRAETGLSRTPGLVVFATRMQDAHKAAVQARPFVDGATIATIQYGTKPEQVVARTLPRDNIVTCVLTMGATCYAPGDVTLNFKGDMVVGKAYSAPEHRVDQVLSVMGEVFTVHKGLNIAHYNCTRLLLNLPYCIPAIIGENVQTAFMDPDMSKVAVMLLKEGIKVIEEAGVHIEPLPDFNENSLKTLLAAPMDEAAARFGDIIMSMSRIPCQGPVLGSIEQGELTEIDFINGEVAKIARELGYPTPLNSLMAGLVHQVERSGRFMAKGEFLKKVEEAAGQG